MSTDSLLFLLHVLGMAGFLWLGLYVLTRGEGWPIATLLGCTALATVGFFLSGGILEVLHEPRAAVVTVNRLSWWATVVPVVLWLHVSLRLNPRAALARWCRPLLWVAYGGAALLVVLGTATDLIRDYHSTVLRSPVDAGGGYALYVAYLFLCAGCAVVNFSLMAWGKGMTSALPGAPPQHPAADAATMALQRPARDDRASMEVRGATARLLVGGAVCFLTGAGLLALNILQHYAWNEVPAYVLLIGGLGAVGAAVAVQSALLVGRDIRRDVVYNVTGLAVVLALYLAAYAALVDVGDLGHGLFALVLAALLTASHTLYDTAREWLDVAFFSPAVRAERAAARAYAAALTTPPVGAPPALASCKAFDDAVRRALTNLSDPTKLATTPLLNLTVVAQGVGQQQLEDNRLNRAAVLKEILLDLLEGLRPPGEARRVTGDAWRFYNCLYYPYARDLGRRRAPTVLRQLAERRCREGGPRSDLEHVLEWMLRVDEDTFYKWQRRGSDAIAAALRERETQAGGMVPAETDEAAAISAPA